MVSVEPADLHAWLVEPCLRPLPPYSRSGSSHLLTTLATISQGRVFNSLGSYQVVCLRQNSSRNPRALHTHLFSLYLCTYWPCQQHHHLESFMYSLYTLFKRMKQKFSPTSDSGGALVQVWLALCHSFVFIHSLGTSSSSRNTYP